jgi:hypothetical protein
VRAWVVGGLTVTAAVLALMACGRPAPSAPVPAPGAAPSAAAGPSSAAASGGAEVNPSGDIPDNQAFVPYSLPNGHFTVSVPEGWSRLSRDGGVMFTDKLNSVGIAAGPQPQAPTVASVRTQELPALQAAVPGYRPGTVSAVTRQAGPAVLITYRAMSVPDPVTGRTRSDAVERYEFWHAGQQVTLTLSGPEGADNVDPWRTVTNSLRWLP